MEAPAEELEDDAEEKVTVDPDEHFATLDGLDTDEDDDEE